LFEYLKTTRADVATYVYDSFAKDEEKVKIPCLDQDVSLNLGLNLLLTTLLCVSLSRNALFLSLKTRKCKENYKRMSGKRGESYLYGAEFVPARLSVHWSLKRATKISFCDHLRAATCALSNYS